MKKTLIRLEKVWFNLFASLFLIGMFNRELNLFGLDFRVYVGLVACLLIPINLVLFYLDKKRLTFFNQPDRKILAFLALAILVNVMWHFNGLNINIGPFMVVLVACVYNLMIFLIFNINRHLINWKNISHAILIAGGVLAGSIVALYMGIDLRNYGSPYLGSSKDISPGFISRLRYGGYAQDPNYASLFMIIWAAVAIYYLIKYRKTLVWWIYLAVLPLAVFGFLASSSKAILAILPLALILTLLSRYRQLVKVLKIGLLVAILGATLVIAFDFIRPNASLTMRGRFGLWRAATSQFRVSPVFGSGLTASRSAAVKQQWYVQPHSSVVQILVDMGIVGLVLIFLILKKNLNSEHKLLAFLTVIFLAHFATHETIYQAYFVFLVGILPLCLTKELPVKTKTAVAFVINGLSNGGAERVVQNMANQLCDQHQVVVYTLGRSRQANYQLDSRIEVVKIANRLSTISAMAAAWRLSRELDKLCNTHQLVLLTAHLPKAHLATRLSSYDQRALYVIHGNSGIKNSFWSRSLMQFLYNRRKLITVSDGLLQGDMIDKFKIKTRSIQTIYNPIDIKAIYDKLTPSVRKKPQIVMVGRLSPPKRPDLAIQAFAKSGLAKTHKLIILGQGELLPQVEAEINKHQLQGRVELRGFVANPFTILQESALMVAVSEYEAFNMAICEAMICNCPVVSFDVYGVSEALTDKLQQFIVPNGNVEALAEKMRLAIDSYPSDLVAIIKPKVDPKKVIDQYFKAYQAWVGF